MGSIVISGGTVVDPANQRHGAFDLRIEDGRIAAVAAPGSAGQADAQIDASGCWVTPGLIDMHVHLREPGYEYKETVLRSPFAFRCCSLVLWRGIMPWPKWGNMCWSALV